MWGKIEWLGPRLGHAWLCGGFGYLPGVPRGCAGVRVPWPFSHHLLEGDGPRAMSKELQFRCTAAPCAQTATPTGSMPNNTQSRPPEARSSPQSWSDSRRREASEHPDGRGRPLSPRGLRPFRRHGHMDIQVFPHPAFGTDGSLLSLKCAQFVTFASGLTCRVSGPRPLWLLRASQRASRLGCCAMSKHVKPWNVTHCIA